MMPSSKPTPLNAGGELLFAAAPPPIPQAPVVQPARRRSTAWIVIVVIAIAIVPVMLIVGLLAAIAIPNFVKARQSSQRAACVAN